MNTSTENGEARQNSSYLPSTPEWECPAEYVLIVTFTFAAIGIVGFIVLLIDVCNTRQPSKHISSPCVIITLNIATIATLVIALVMIAIATNDINLNRISSLVFGMIAFQLMGTSATFILWTIMDILYKTRTNNKTSSIRLIVCLCLVRLIFFIGACVMTTFIVMNWIEIPWMLILIGVDSTFMGILLVYSATRLIHVIGNLTKINTNNGDNTYTVTSSPHTITNVTTSNTSMTRGHLSRRSPIYAYYQRVVLLRRGVLICGPCSTILLISFLVIHRIMGNVPYPCIWFTLLLVCMYITIPIQWYYANNHQSSHLSMKLLLLAPRTSIVLWMKNFNSKYQNVS
jgi:hypothetical protein